MVGLATVISLLLALVTGSYLTLAIEAFDEAERLIVPYAVVTLLLAVANLVVQERRR